MPNKRDRMSANKAYWVASSLHDRSLTLCMFHLCKPLNLAVTCSSLCYPIVKLNSDGRNSVTPKVKRPQRNKTFKACLWLIVTDQSLGNLDISKPVIKNGLQRTDHRITSSYVLTIYLLTILIQPSNHFTSVSSVSWCSRHADMDSQHREIFNIYSNSVSTLTIAMYDITPNAQTA